MIELPKIRLSTWGKSDFEEDGTQNYLVFQSIYRYFRGIIGVGSGNYIYFWKSIGLSDERLKSNTASNYKVIPKLSYYGTKIRVEFNGSCLKQDKVMEIMIYSWKNSQYMHCL